MCDLLGVQDRGVVYQLVFTLALHISCQQLGEYDKVSDQPFIWVREMDESESGQMVLEKVKWTFSDAYLWQTMWNHAKKSMEGSKLSDSVFLQWEVTDWQELFAKNGENKGN